MGVANERDMSKHIAGSITADTSLYLLASLTTTYTCHGEGHRLVLIGVPSGQATARQRGMNKTVMQRSCGRFEVEGKGEAGGP